MLTFFHNLYLYAKQLKSDICTAVWKERKMRGRKRTGSKSHFFVHWYGWLKWQHTLKTEEETHHHFGTTAALHPLLASASPWKRKWILNWGFRYEMWKWNEVQNTENTEKEIEAFTLTDNYATSFFSKLLTFHSLRNRLI